MGLGAFVFDGVNDGVELSKEDIIGNDTTFTIEAWINSKSITSTQTIYGEFGNGEGGSTDGHTRNFFSFSRLTECPR